MSDVASTPTQETPAQPDVKTNQPPAEPAKTVFSQEQVNKIVGERIAKEKEAQDLALRELDAIRKKSEMTAKDKQEWETKYNQLLEKNMTGEELKQRELEKAKREKEETETKLSKEVNHWRDSFFDSLITNNVKSASEEHLAWSSKQIENNLRNLIKVVPMRDEKGADIPNKYQPRVSFPDRTKDGGEITLDLTVSEAVARMKEMKDFSNLFKGKGYGGAGEEGSSEIASGSAEDYARRGPEVYRKAVAEGKIKF